MKNSYVADLVTIGQWIEEKVCFGTFGTPYTSNEKYQDIGTKFVNSISGNRNLSDEEIHKIMKNVVTYRLTPAVINFIYKNQKELHLNPVQNSDHRKTIMFLTDKALCYFCLTDVSVGSLPMESTSLCVRDFSETYPEETVVIELNGVESLEKGAGKDLMKKIVASLSDVPILLQAGYSHYGDYEYAEKSKISELVEWYKSFGFVDMNAKIGCYTNSVVMLKKPESYKLKERSGPSWDDEYNLWMSFYLTFNDDNPRHADNAFYNNHLDKTTQGELHAENIGWVKEAFLHGVTEEEILAYIPNAKQYIEEARAR